MKYPLFSALLLLSIFTAAQAEDSVDAKMLFGDTPIELGAVIDIDDPWVAFMSDRFILDDDIVIAMIEDTGSYADAYLVFLMASRTEQTPDDVAALFKKNMTRGWGYIAQLLDIKPGSDDFKTLKTRTTLAMAPGSNRNKSG